MNQLERLETFARAVVNGVGASYNLAVEQGILTGRYAASDGDIRKALAQWALDGTVTVIPNRYADDIDPLHPPAIHQPLETITLHIKGDTT